MAQSDSKQDAPRFRKGAKDLFFHAQKYFRGVGGRSKLGKASNGMLIALSGGAETPILAQPAGSRFHFSEEGVNGFPGACI